MRDRVNREFEGAMIAKEYQVVLYLQGYKIKLKFLVFQQTLSFLQRKFLVGSIH